MTTMITILSLSLTSYWSMISMNPIKVSMMVLASSTLIFFYMGIMTGLTWFPLLLLMLFMGGIILMFMILSSILPNEKSMKVKAIIPIFMCLTLVTTFEWSEAFTMDSVSASSNSFLSSTKNFIFMVNLILFYFTASMSMLSSEKTPMRSISCY